MNVPEWQLAKVGDMWTLEIQNPEFETIPVNSKFKYRINDGEWLQPPTDAPNESGGDLVFMKSETTKGLKAEIIDEYTIWADVSGERPLLKSAYKVTDAKGNEVAIAEVLPNTASLTLVKTAEKMDVKRVYFLEIEELDLKAFCSYDGWFRNMYSSKELGANISEEQTTIRVFAPRADLMRVYLYKGKDDDNPYHQENMIRDKDGVWEVTFNENLKVFITTLLFTVLMIRAIIFMKPIQFILLILMLVSVTIPGVKPVFGIKQNPPHH